MNSFIHKYSYNIIIATSLREHFLGSNCCRVSFLKMIPCDKHCRQVLRQILATSGQQNKYCDNK